MTVQTRGMDTENLLQPEASESKPCSTYEGGEVGFDDDFAVYTSRWWLVIIFSLLGVLQVVHTCISQSSEPSDPLPIFKECTMEFLSTDF